MELILSIVALAAGPILFPVVKRRPQFLCGMDGFVFVAIVGLSLFHMMPEAIEHAGWWALLSAVAGILGPFLFGRKLHHAGQRNVHNIFILIAVVGLALHAMIDGAAIFHGAHGTHEVHSDGTVEHVHMAGMVAAVLIHRVPMSMLIWWSLRPRMGNLISAGALGILAGATTAGYALGGAFDITPAVMGHLVAFVAGSLVHVVGHDTASELIPRHCQDTWHATYSAVGGAIAALGLFYFGHFHALELPWARFSSLFVKAAPALLIGFTLGGLMEAGFGGAMIARLRGRTRLGNALRGVVFGTPIPICSCGVETVYEALVKRRIPAAAAVAFLLAAPAMTLDSMALSVRLLGVELTVARVVFATLVAVVGAVIASYFIKTTRPADAHGGEHEGDPEKRSLGTHAVESLRKGWVEQIDHVAPWVVVGFGVVALMWPTLESGLLARLAPGLDVVVMTVLAAPFYLNASAMTAMAAALLAGGASVGAVLAMLVASPSLNVAVLALVKKLHGARTMWLIFGVGLSLTLGLGFLTNLLAPTHLGAVEMALMGDILLADSTWLEYGATAMLATLFLLSYFRMGPRGMMLQLLPVEHHHMHDHGHEVSEHDHGHHDHGHHDHGHHDHDHAGHHHG